MNQSHTPGRVPPPSERQRVNRVLSRSLKRVRPCVLLSLLLAKRLHGAPGRLFPVGMKTRSVARCLPVSMSESHGITERVDLPLTLAQLFAYRGLVVLAPRAGLRAEVERVGVR